MIQDYTFSAPALRPEYTCGIGTRKKGPGRALLRQKLPRNYSVKRSVKLTDELLVARIVTSIRYDCRPT
jgi:hypothetical protein